MTDQPGTAGRPSRRFAGCLLPFVLAGILLAAAIFMRPMQPAPAAAPAPAAPAAVSAAGAPAAAQPLVQPGSDAAAAAVPAPAGEFPALTGPVVDEAGVLPADVKARLEQKLIAFNTQTQRQLQVVTLAGLRDYDIADYSNRLFRNWQLGDKSRNDGVMLVIAPKERRMRIEVGYGMEPIVTDGISYIVISQVITPRFKAGDLPGGIEAGTDALIKQMQLPPDQAAAIAAKANADKAKLQKDSRSGFDPTSLIWLGFIFLFFILPMLRRLRGGRAYSGSGLGPVILWNVLDGMSRGGGSNWGGGGGSDWGGGGGWSGGGGSSGGGGASGSW